MNQIRIRSAAALVLVVCLTVAPAASAELFNRRELPGQAREKISRFLDTVRRFFVDVVTLEDFPAPPRP